MSFPVHSIATRIIIALVTITTLLLGTFGAGYYAYDRNRQFSLLRAELAKNADQLAAGLISPVWDYDDTQIDRIIKSLFINPDIYGVMADVTGKRHIRQRDDGWRVSTGNTVIAADGLLVEKRELIHDNTSIGHITVFASPRFTREALEQTLFLITTLILLADLILILSLYMIIWVIILKPLKHIEHYAMTCSAGRTGCGMTIKKSGFYGEIENLCDSIQKMVSLLDSRYDEIESSARTLQKSQEFLHNIVENIPAMIFVKDATDLRFLMFNRAGEELLGYSRDELLGKNDHDFFPVHEADFFTEKDREVIEGQRLLEIPEESIQTRHGGQRILHTKKIPVFDRQGKPQYLLGISMDITDRKRAEAERERLMMAIQQAGEIITITDPDGTIQYVNPAFEKLTGYSRQEVVGQNPRILKSGQQDPDFYHDLWKVITGGRIWQGRIVNRHKNGTLYTVETSISPVLDASGRIVNFVAVQHDITEHLRLTAQYQQAQKMESIGRLAGGVAHDFNNMLNVISGYTELALGQLKPEDPITGNLEEVLAAARRSADITRQLLAFARRQTVAPKVLDMNETVEGMLKMLRRLIGEDIDLSWKPGSRLGSVNIDPSQIDQILANLCVNARDAISGVGRLTIETANVRFDPAYCADHAGFVPGEYVMLAVSDDGCGMNKETLSNLFEPFFTTKEVGQGTGLGLATVYGIVRQNEGFINVYSEPDQGTTFRIYLPRHTEKVEQPQNLADEKITSGHGETILVVEDEISVLKLAHIILERLGYTVLAAATPADAECLADEHSGRIHLLITDVVMPFMNGRELAARLQTRHPEIKTLFMSGYTANVIAHHGVLDKGVHFMQKPFSRSELAEKVREALGG
ncbi:MAG: PAS domain S-box protein [Desulfatirhabdiaceae bacterium]